MGRGAGRAREGKLKGPASTVASSLHLNSRSKANRSQRDTLRLSLTTQSPSPGAAHCSCSRLLDFCHSSPL